jgi:hypothetical protein
VGTDSPVTEADMPEIEQNTWLVLKHYANHCMTNTLIAMKNGIMLPLVQRGAKTPVSTMARI